MMMNSVHKLQRGFLLLLINREQCYTDHCDHHVLRVSYVEEGDTKTTPEPGVENFQKLKMKISI